MEGRAAAWNSKKSVSWAVLKTYGAGLGWEADTIAKAVLVIGVTLHGCCDCWEFL